MKRFFVFLGGVLLQAVLIGALPPATGGAPQSDKGKDAKAGTPNCLACHGPFDKLAAATADYEAPSGEKTSPHKYIPHSDKSALPECTECHRPHPVPLEDKSAVVKATVEFCYTNCHHTRNLQACSTCH
jgi:hypothetical protein